MKNTNFKKPFLYLVFNLPKFNDLYSNQDGSVLDFLENKYSEKRYAGWCLPNKIKYSIGSDNKIFIDTENRKVQVFEDGTVIIQVSLDKNFLSWASPDDKTVVNPTALIEFVYNSVYVIYKLIEIQNTSAQPEIEVILGIKTDYDLYLKPNNESLIYHDTLGKFSYNDTNQNPEQKIELNILKKSEVITYQIIEKIYILFQKKPDLIPYVKVNNNNKYIDFEQILKL